MLEYYVCDFETVNDEYDCRVWLWARYNIYDNTIKYGTDIDSFFYGLNSNCKLFFHNLKFDGEFLINYLFRNGYTYKEKNLYDKNFSTLISDTGQFYNMKVKKGKATITIIDSLKILPMSVKNISLAFNLEDKKGSIDYNRPRPVGYEPTKLEYDYIHNDVKIVSQALKILISQGLNKNTQSSNAFKDYNDMIGGPKGFRRIFPYFTL